MPELPDPGRRSPARLVCAPLALLELRRTAGGGAAVLTAVLAVLLASADWTPAALEAGALEKGGADLSSLARGLRRQAVWTGTLLFALPALTLHAGGVLARWRSGEADWLGARPTGRLAALVSCWLGVVAGGLALLACAGAAVEVASGGGGLARERVWSHSLDDFARLEPGTALTVDLALPGELPAGSSLVVRLRPSVGAAPATGVRATAERGGQSSTARAHVSTWTDVALAAPSGRGAATLSIANVGPGALAVLAPDSFAVWAPAGGEWRGSARILSRAALALATLAALAIAFSAWVSAWTAAAAAVCAWLVAENLLGAPEWWPGAGLPSALGRAALARLPEPTTATATLVALAVVALALGATAAALRSWRHGD